MGACILSPQEERVVGRIKSGASNRAAELIEGVRGVRPEIDIERVCILPNHSGRPRESL